MLLLDISIFSAISFCLVGYVSFLRFIFSLFLSFFLFFFFQEHTVSLGCLSMPFHPSLFKRGLDIMQLFNCYYMAWFLSHTMIQASDEAEWGYFFLIPLPSLLMQILGKGEE